MILDVALTAGLALAVLVVLFIRDEKKAPTHGGNREQAVRITKQ